MYVGRRMTPNPITVKPDTTHPEALALMREHHIRQLPVVNAQGRLVGIVSEEDLLSTQPSPATTLSIYEIYSLLDNLKISTIMSSPVFTVQEDCPLEAAARIMMEERIGSLPVMRGEQLVGIITGTDVLRALIEALAGTQEGLSFSVRLEDKPGALASVLREVAEAGGNLVSVVTFHSPEVGRGEIFIKEQGANRLALEEGIRDRAHADLIDMGPSRHYEPQLFGKP